MLHFKYRILKLIRLCRFEVADKDIFFGYYVKLMREKNGKYIGIVDIAFIKGRDKIEIEEQSGDTIEEVIEKVKTKVQEFVNKNHYTTYQLFRKEENFF